jgi:glycosyltransferase involved in cell wall biosynthesis
MLSVIATKFLIIPLAKYSKNLIIHTQNSFQTNFYKKLGFSKENIIEIPQHNINFKDYSINPKREGFSVAFLGRLTESKGIDLLIEVANLNPEMTFHIIGKGQLKQHINNMNRNRNLILHGFVTEEQKRKILASCDVMIVPSYFESLSIASIEGLASGLSLVASQTAQGLKYIINKSELFGVLLPRDKIYFSKELNLLRNKKKDNFDNFIKEREEIRKTAMKQFDETKILESLSEMVKRSERNHIVNL